MGNGKTIFVVSSATCTIFSMIAPRNLNPKAAKRG